MLLPFRNELDTTIAVLEFSAWKAFFAEEIKNWKAWIRFYMTRFKGDVHLVFYENMKSDLRAELIRMRAFLQVPVDCMRLWCANTSQNQTKFKRKVSDSQIT